MHCHFYFFKLPCTVILLMGGDGRNSYCSSVICTTAVRWVIFAWIFKEGENLHKAFSGRKTGRSTSKIIVMCLTFWEKRKEVVIETFWLKICPCLLHQASLSLFLFLVFPTSRECLSISQTGRALTCLCLCYFLCLEHPLPAIPLSLEYVNIPFT